MKFGREKFLGFWKKIKILRFPGEIPAKNAKKEQFTLSQKKYFFGQGLRLERGGAMVDRWSSIGSHSPCVHHHCAHLHRYIRCHTSLTKGCHRRIIQGQKNRTGRLHRRKANKFKTTPPAKWRILSSPNELYFNAGMTPSMCKLLRILSSFGVVSCRTALPQS